MKWDEATKQKLLSGDIYHHRVMVGIIVAQLIMIGFFKLWPDLPEEPRTFPTFGENAFIVEEMIVTTQASAPASPPKPSVPVPVPNDEVIEEEIEFPDINDLMSMDEFAEEYSTGQTGNESRISGNPDRPPRVVKIVEPPMPDEAKRAGIKAIIYVNFLVDAAGNVEEAYIAEIRRYAANGRDYEVVKSLDYGLLEATIEAAYKWKFRPASERGEKVGAYAKNTFSFGF